MKFKINRDHFANGLAQVLNVVGSKATMPILSNVLIEAEKDQISLTTTNLDLGIRCKIKAEVKETGSVTLPVKRLATIVAALVLLSACGHDCPPGTESNCRIVAYITSFIMVGNVMVPQQNPIWSCVCEALG